MDPDPILAQIRDVVMRGDFTLGREVGEFEENFAETTERSHAIGVGSGTDALKVPLRALGVGPGDEVITVANTFWATVGAITEVGAKPVFIDCGKDMQMDPGLLESAITPKTKAIIPVHLTGNIAKMPDIMAIADRHNIPVIEDACQSQMARRGGKISGSWGIASAFSMHPLKILNVWGDAGVIVTDDTGLDRRLRLLRNHGLRNRDEMECLGYNTRLDTVQAVVGKHILATVDWIGEQRKKNAARYVEAFSQIPELELPEVDDDVEHMYLFFVMFTPRRDDLSQYCADNGIETKIHYPIPIYRQEALHYLDLPQGTFPETDRQADQCISFPVDQHLSDTQIDHVITTVQSFFQKAG